MGTVITLIGLAIFTLFAVALWYGLSASYRKEKKENDELFN